MLSSNLKNEVYNYLKNKILTKIEEYELNEGDASKPFQYALFTQEGYLAKGFIHSCETSLGSWHESLAKIIAKHNFKIAKKLENNSKIQGYIPREAERKFENILSDLDSGVREPNPKNEWEEIFKASQSYKDLETRIQTVDLYLETKNNEEIYLEIKGPKPNKNEMRAAKRDLLEIYTMRAQENKKVRVYLGMYYNPYFPENYKRWTCLNFFKSGEDFLVGKDFWDFLGGERAYEQLIEIYEQVGTEIRPKLENKLKNIKK